MKEMSVSYHFCRRNTSNPITH